MTSNNNNNNYYTNIHLAAPIRGPEWSGAQVTRTSLRVEPLSKAQMRKLQSNSFRRNADAKRHQIQTYIGSVLMPSPLNQKQKVRRTDKAEKIIMSSDDFRDFKKEVGATGLQTTNVAMLNPILDQHQSPHRLMRSWNAKSP